MNLLNKHNLKAAGIHLLISFAISALAMVLVYGVWYPAPLDAALEVSKIFLTILAVDLALGPLLTLVVYKPHKASLKMDLTVVACLQLAALLYGLHTVGSARPAYMVFSKDRFDLVLAHEMVTLTGEGKALNMLPQSPWQAPLWGSATVGAQVPSFATNGDLNQLLTLSAMSGGADVANVLDLHRPYASVLGDIQKTAVPLSAIKGDAAKKARFSSYPAGSVVSPLKIKFTIYAVVLEPAMGKVLGIEPVDVF